MKTLQYIGWTVIIALFFAACQPKEENQSKQEKKEEARPVKTMTLKKVDIERTIDYPATLSAFEEVYFAPSQPGRIHKIYVEVGDRVKKGQLLVKMDQTQLTQALLQVENARTHFYRMDTLKRLNSISDQQYDQAKTQYEVAVSNLEFLQENTKLKAPFNGVVTDKYYKDGEMYSGAPNTQVGKAAIVTLMQLSPLKAEVSITEKYFPDINEGMEVTLESDIYPGEIFKGRVYRVYPTINPATRTFKTEVKINNRDKILRPGMFTKVHIKLKDDVALMVPAISVVKQEGTNNRYIFVNKNNRAHRIDVKIGSRHNDKVELVSDELQEGMELIIAGQANLMEGDLISVRN